MRGASFALASNASQASWMRPALSAAWPRSSADSASSAAATPAWRRIAVANNSRARVMGCSLGSGGDASRVAELAGTRATPGAALYVRRPGDDAVLGRDLDLQRLGAALAPHPRHVLARLEVAERELLRTVDGHVVRRVDHEDECRHVRVHVAAESDEAGLLERHRARLAVLEQAD